MASCLHQGQCPFWSISPCVKREPCRRNVCFHPPYLTSRLRSRAPRADRNARYLWSSRRKTTMPGPCRVLSRDSSQAAITIFQASTFRPTCSSDGKEHAVPNLITDCRAFESPGGRDSGRPVPARGVFRRVRRDQRNARRCVRVKVRNHVSVVRLRIATSRRGPHYSHHATLPQLSPPHVAPCSCNVWDECSRTSVRSAADGVRSASWDFTIEEIIRSLQGLAQLNHSIGSYLRSMTHEPVTPCRGACDGALNKVYASAIRTGRGHRLEALYSEIPEWSEESTPPAR